MDTNINMLTVNINVDAIQKLIGESHLIQIIPKIDNTQKKEDVLSLSDSKLATFDDSNKLDMIFEGKQANLFPIFKHNIVVGTVPPIIKTQRCEIQRLVFETDIIVPGGAIITSRRWIEGKGIMVDLPVCKIVGSGIDAILGETKEIIEPDQWILKSRTRAKCTKTANTIKENDNITIRIIELKVCLKESVNIMFGNICVKFPGNNVSVRCLV
jgi:hypothetical protein